MSKTNTAQDLQQKEWQTARDVIASFDDRLDALRRYGFTIIAGLLTAQSLLESNLIPETSSSGTTSPGTSMIQPSVKLAVILATLILIFALRLLDRNYVLYQEAAIKRAEVIEKSLNLGLTETMDDVYHHDHLWLPINLIYGLFAGATCLLGWFLLAGTDWATTSIIAATVLTVFGIGVIQRIRIEHRLYYSFDKLKITKGDSLIITVTNLGKRRVIPKASFKWYMQPQDGQPLPDQENPVDLVLEADEPHYLKWDTAPSTVSTGFYRFVVRENKKSRPPIKGETVRRIIQVLPSSHPTPLSLQRQAT
jgi:hypothetical protein